MSIQGKSLKDITEDDLQSLIENQVAEGKYIEYKSILPGNSDADKREFLFDISSFANCAGGHIFYGILEENSLPKEIVGLGPINPDDVKQRMENLLRDSIRPRILGHKIEPIPTANNGPVMGIHIPRSWSSPHMVIFGGISRFYSRNSIGKYQLDVDELRTAFTAGYLEGERVRNFYLSRIGHIVAGETPVPLSQGAKVSLHLIPIDALQAGKRHDLRQFESRQNRKFLAPICSADGNGFTFNFDGVLTSVATVLGPAGSYLQLFRNGIIESVAADFVFNQKPEFHLIYIDLFEKELVKSLNGFLKIQHRLGNDPPFFVILTLLGVKGYNFPSSHGLTYTKPIDRDYLLIPEILVQDATLLPETILQPAFDAVWNAVGEPRSTSYHSDGRWTSEVI